jgi:hypothetical protein
MSGTEEERDKRIAEAAFIRERGLWAPGSAPWNDSNKNTTQDAQAPDPAPMDERGYHARVLALQISAKVHEDFTDTDAMMDDAERFLAFLLGKPARPAKPAPAE